MGSYTDTKLYPNTYLKLGSVSPVGTLLDLSFNSGIETFEDYDTGNVSTLAGGSGFAGPATLTLYTE